MIGRRGKRSAADVDGWEAPDTDGPEDMEDDEADGAAPLPGWRGRGRRTRRLVLVALAGSMALPLAYPYSQWRSQQAELDRLRESNTAQEKRIADLREEVSHWSDPRYVAEQAQERLRWAREGQALLIVVGKGN